MKERHTAGKRSPIMLATPKGGAVPAADALTPGGAVFGLTCGQFSLLDLVRALLDRTGPADVRISTWSTGICDAEAAKWLITSGGITRLRLYTDRSFPTRQPTYAAALVGMFGEQSIVCTDVHAKIACISGGDWRIVVRSSMNLNKNPRFEQYDIDDNPAMFDFVSAWLDELDRLAPHGFVFSHAESEIAFRDALTSGIHADDAVEAMTGAKAAPPKPKKAAKKKPLRVECPIRRMG